MRGNIGGNINIEKYRTWKMCISVLVGISVTDSVHLTAKITLLFVPDYTSVDRGSSQFNFFMMSFAMAAQNFAQGPKSRQHVFRTKSKKAAVAIFLTRGLTTVKRGHHSRHSYRIQHLDIIQGLGNR